MTSPSTLRLALTILAALTWSAGGCAQLSESAAPAPAPAARAVAVALPGPMRQGAAAATAPTSEPTNNPLWNDVSRAIERRGIEEDEVYTITVPRDDLDVTIEGSAIPTAAGIESVFHFYGCPCGRISVAGQFVTADYETDDVVDALRQNAAMRVASISPMFLFDKPRLLLVRFQGDGDAVALAKVIREAMRWTGKERMAPQQVDDPKPATKP